jgi:anti-sigma factor RsiW
VSGCDGLRPALSRVAAGDGDPADALRVAEHVPDCTTCRILLAKERRLARILEHELEDEIGVDEAFLRGVMARLPEGPPPRKRRVRRGLEIATSIGGWLLLGAAVAQWLAAAGQAAPSLQPRLDVPVADGLLGSLEALATLALGVLGGLGAALDVVPRLLPHTLVLTLGVAVPVAIVSAGAAAMLGMAALRRSGASVARRRRSG